MIKIVTESLQVKTSGDPDLVNITGQLERVLSGSKLACGTMTVFVVGSTAGITTLEYEPGLIADLGEFYEKLVPRKKNYRHDQTWQDANGFSHLRASLTGPSLVIPFKDKKLVLGTWQQVVLAEFDNRPRNREIVVQLAGE